MREPNWKRWEVVLLVDMYFKIKEDGLDVKEECQNLSYQLRQYNLDRSLVSETYRNVHGILMKYNNIRQIVEGTGLPGYSKLDTEIVALHQTNITAFAEELNKIQSCQ